MSRRCRWAKETGIAFERSLWCGIFASAFLLGSLSGAPSASATLVGKAAGPGNGIVDSVGPTVTSVSAPTAPSLPSATSPSQPQAPAPVAPQLPQGAVKPPTEATQATPPSSSASSGAGGAFVDGIAGAARNRVGSVTRADEKTAARRTASAHSDSGSTSVSQGGAGASLPRATTDAGGSVPGAPLSIPAADIAAAERWIARVWPGIPLGGGAGGTGPLGGAASALLHPAVLAATQLLALVPSLLQRAGDSPSAIPPATANTPELTLSDASVSTDWMKVVYLVTLIVLLALLAFTIWKEMGPVLRASMR
jgi:hypothetical protein